MNKQKRTYLDMQFEEASLQSGRYNTDYGLISQDMQPTQSLLGRFLKAVQASGEFKVEPFTQLAAAQTKSANSN